MVRKQDSLNEDFFSFFFSGLFFFLISICCRIEDKEWRSCKRCKLPGGLAQQSPPTVEELCDEGV